MATEGHGGRGKQRQSHAIGVHTTRRFIKSELEHKFTSNSGQLRAELQQEPSRAERCTKAEDERARNVYSAIAIRARLTSTRGGDDDEAAQAMRGASDRTTHVNELRQ